MLDAIIVGQGLAGTTLACNFLQANKKIVVIDDNLHGASSVVGAGIVNPLIGRKFALSWNFGNLAKIARTFYRQMEIELDTRLVYDYSILRSIHETQTYKEVLLKTADPLYNQYLQENIEWEDLKSAVQPAHETVGILGGFRVDISAFVRHTRISLLNRKLLLNEAFDFKQLVLNENEIHYRNLKAKCIVFCEGAKGALNPYFSYLPFNLSKGEVLIIQAEKLPHKYIYKNRIFLVPLEDGLFWVGSADSWQFKNDEPSESGRNRLEEKLTQILNVPYTIVDHKSAVRPTVKTRRPFLGHHPEHQPLFIFNGLGTKGTSLAPAMAEKMYDFMYNDEALPPECDIKVFNQ